MMNTASADRNSSRRKIPILIAGVVVLLAIFYVITHRERHLTAVVSSAPRPQARATTATSSAAHSSAASAAAFADRHAMTVTRAGSESSAAVIPSPTATGPATGKFLHLEAAGDKRYLEQYDPHATTDIPIIMDVTYGRVQKLSERLDAGLDPNMTVQSGSEPEYSTSMTTR